MLRIIFFFIITIIPLLSDIYIYECTFPQYSDKKYHLAKDDMNITFKYDSFSDKAYMEGNNGISPLELLVKKGGLITFFEITDAGNITVTSIHPKTHEAVHSRHMKIFNQMITSQYYGSCKYNKKVSRLSKTNRKNETPADIQKKVYAKLNLENELNKLSPLEQRVILNTLAGNFPTKEIEAKLSKDAIILYISVMAAVGEELFKKQKAKR